MGTNIHLIEVDEGPEFIETGEDEKRAVGPVVTLAKAYEREFDALIIGCFGDVGISELRNSLAIPVVGPARATYAVAAALFPTFGVIALNDEAVAEEGRMARRIGIEASKTCIRAANVRVSSIITHPEETLERIARVLRDIDAPAALPACMGIAFLLEERGISELEGVHIVNPLHCAVRFAVASLI